MTSTSETEPLLPSVNAEHEYGSRPAGSSSQSSTTASTSSKAKLPIDDDASSYDSEDDSDSDDESEIKEKRAQRIKEGGWRAYLRDFSIFLPHLIPKHDRKVQFSIAVSVVCLAALRVLNVLVPHQLGVVADKLLDRQAPYLDLLLWLVLSILHDNSGLGLVLELATIPITQFSERSVTNAAFAHVLSLGMDFHSERDSAEVMKALEQGGALTKLLKTAVTDILPTIIDLTVAIGILYWKFDVYASATMVLSFSSFLALEVWSSRYKVEPRRKYASAGRKEAKVMHQGIQGWTTLSYFNMFSFEKRRLARAVDNKMTADWSWSVRDNVLSALVELLIPLTFFALAAMAIFNVRRGTSKTGDFVFLLQYWDYLIWPLRYLSHDYREIMSNLIDAERLLALLQTRPTIVDSPTAEPPSHVDGHIAFNDVSFAYSARKQTLSNISLTASPGRTIALVGPTGAGKSTLTKLLLRFHDVTAGSITLDGVDIRDLPQSSLRDAIGVVPQDPYLFNASILANLRYANREASFSDIVAACKAAAIHSRIAAFPDGYETRVGENGVKLSGGEIQRLALARVLLKDPAILILDEATSAVDTRTESEMKRALETLKGGRKRTTFVVAHRLGTVVAADEILVVEGGRIVERGSHTELLDKGGVYAGLWEEGVKGVGGGEPVV